MPPPLKGTTGSPVPWICSTDTGRDGAHGTPDPRVPATGATAATFSFDGLAFDARNSRYMIAGGDLRNFIGDTSRPATDKTLRGAVKRGQETHVVDALTVGHRRTAAVGPAEVDAVGVGHHESVLIGDRVVAGQSGLIGTGHPGAVQIQHQCHRGSAGRCMHHVGAR